VKLREELKRSKIYSAWGDFPGLRASLVDLSCVGIKIEDLSLGAVRYGLTKKNILKAVESQLHEENIKTYYYPRDSKNDNFGLYLKISDRPQLHIEVECNKAVVAGTYMGLVSIYMKKYRSTPWESNSGEYITDEFLKAVKKQGVRAIEKMNTNIFETTWERQCLLLGKLDNFAEDEKNLLEELVGEFINDYLAANPTIGKDAQAILDYSKAIEIDPGNAEAYLKRGLAYAKQYQRGDYFNEGVWDKAIADFSKVIEIEPRNIEVYFKRAALYWNKGQDSMAILDYTKVIEIDPRNAKAYYKRANAYDGKGKHDQAIADYTKVIEIEPRNAEACYRRGEAYYFKKEYDKAILDYSKVIAIEPRNAEAYYERANCYFFNNEYDKADKALKDVQKAQSLGYKVEPSTLKLFQGFSKRFGKER
jgi:tetratricopeptide (TPR) repeat protein